MFVSVMNQLIRPDQHLVPIKNQKRLLLNDEYLNGYFCDQGKRQEEMLGRYPKEGAGWWGCA